jgi:SAM-dependent methyltransferase
MNLDRCDVLHFAPDGIEDFLSARAKRYVKCDYLPSDATTDKIDIEDINYADGSFDLIICSHVLEHVDCNKSLRELYRILRPKGRALLLFPIVEGWSETFEDPSIVLPQDRLRYFGQKDHVRIFGCDVRDRIKSFDFDLTESLQSSLMSAGTRCSAARRYSSPSAASALTRCEVVAAWDEEDLGSAGSGWCL